MHELSIARGIIDIVNSEARTQGFKKVISIGLGFGEYSGIVPKCLEEFFPYAAQGTLAEGARLDMQVLPASFKCRDCGFEGAVERSKACCPECGSTAINMVSGREFFVEKLEVE